MTVQDGKIIKATEQELFEFWLKQWSDLLPYEEYKQRIKTLGTVITE